MSEFGSTLFRGSRVVFWGIVPVALLAAVILPISVVKWTVRATVVTFVLESALVLLVLVLWRPQSFARAGRALCGLVFLAFLSYLISELSQGSRLSLSFGSRSQASANNALLGLLFIGIPALTYALLGRFSIRPEIEDPPESPPGSEDAG